MLINVVFLIKLKDSPICQQIGLEWSLFFDRLRLYTQATIFFTFAPAYV